MAIPDNKEFLTTKEAAEFMRRHYRTLEDWRKEKKGPRHYAIGSPKKPCILYRRRDIEDWLARHVVEGD